jgi:hypothetical protein
MQLNLFEWDIVAIGTGYTSLARLDFNEARNWFTRVLQSFPDHPRAHQGMREVIFPQFGARSVKPHFSVSSNPFQT